MNTVPLEIDEQKTLVQYLELKGLKYSAIGHDMYSTSWKQKSRNKQIGVKRGLPDMLVIVNGHLLFIEMKRQKGGVVSDHQKSWIAALNNETGDCVQAFVARGADEAIQIVDNIMGK